MTAPIPTLRTRRPTGIVPWPLILVEGAEKAGKSWAAAEFSASDRVGRTLWLDVDEGAADEYASITGARYEVLIHDGTWPELIGQVEAAHAEAHRAAEAGEKPVVLVIDSMTAVWNQLKDQVSYRARSTEKAQQILARDPDAEIKPGRNLWNDAAIRHARLMHLLTTFPGIAVVTARGKTISATDDAGQPIRNSREHKVEGHKDLAYAVSAWVRLSRDDNPMIVGVRSVQAGIRPGVDKPKIAPQFSLEWLVFEYLGCDPATAHVRDHQQPHAEDCPPLSDQEVDVLLAEIGACDTVEDVSALGRRVSRRLKVSPRGDEITDVAKARQAAIAAAAAERAEQDALAEAAESEAAAAAEAAARAEAMAAADAE